jgi:uncharacterized membrane protein
MNQIKSKFKNHKSKILIFIFALILPFYAKADEFFDIKNFNADITINEDSSFAVTETIDVYFKQDRHGIYRDLDTQGISVQIGGITNQNNAPWNYTLEGFDLGTRIKIGDADIYVNGDQTYKITYGVSGGIRFFDDHDELYWNATGNFWPAVIEKSSATVNLPSGVDPDKITIACYTGSYGSTGQDCAAEVSGNTVKFTYGDVLNPYEGMTIVVGIPKGVLTEPSRLKVMSNVGESSVFLDGGKNTACKTDCEIPLLPGTHQVQIKKWGYVSSSIIDFELSAGKSKEISITLQKTWWWPILKILMTILLIFIAIEPIISFYRKGRDPRGKGTIIPEYEPPDKLTPVLMGSLVDERADMRDITSTLIDLAVRGFVKIKKIPGKKLWIFKAPDDYELIRQEPKPGLPKDLSEFENKLLKDVFESKQNIKISGLRNEFYTNLPGLKEMIYKDLVEKEYFPASPEKTRAKYIVKGILFIFLGIMLSVAGIVIMRSGLAFLIIINGILTLIFAKSMPQKTAKGKEAYEHILGFKLYLETAEKDRLHFEEKEDLFYKFLPYAMTLGIAKKWSKAFGGIFKKPPEWYEGDGDEFRLPVFVSSLNSVSGQIGSAFASRPGSGGGGSGFSGGFSGGGGGGGGGGSW